MKLLIASFSSLLNLKSASSFRLPFPVYIPDGQTELTVHGNLIDWLSENDSEYKNSTDADGILRNGGIKISIPFLTKYGCWCYRGDDYPGKGKGKPMDLFDQVCKTQHMAFDCIIEDAYSEDPDCVIDTDGDYSGCCKPQATEYSWGIEPNLSNPGEYNIECKDDDDTTWCQTNTCMVDLKFVVDYWELTNDGLAPDYENYGHPDHSTDPGTFDTEDCQIHLPIVGAGGQPVEHTIPRTQDHERVCCGDYPYRFWYLTALDGSDDRSCCEYVDVAVQSEYGGYAFFVGAMYHENTQDCCDDGPKVFGSCP